MSISLQKGQKVSLVKENGSGLERITVGLGWDEVPNKGGFFKKAPPVDCDASVIMLKGGKFSDKDDVVYFGNLSHKSGAINHMGDNLTGAGAGDDEQLTVDLTRIPADYDRIVFVVNIYDCVNRKQNFGNVANAFIRIVDNSSNTEILKYNLTENYSSSTAVLFGEIYKNGSEWKFAALGQGTTDPGLGQVIQRFA